MDSVAIHSFLLAEDNARALHSLLHSFAYSRQTHYAVAFSGKSPGLFGKMRMGHLAVDCILALLRAVLA